MERWFTMKFHLRYYRYRFYPDCSLCSRWCHYLASCRSQTWSWWNHCRLKFKYSEHFYITTVPRGEDLPLLEIDVNLCKTIYYRRSRNNDKIFTINITEHKNGMGSIKNGLYKRILCLIDIKVILGVNRSTDFVLHS